MPGVRDHKQLNVWKLSDEVRVRVHRLCQSTGLRTQFDLAAQLRNAADSACANIAEGFSRFDPKEFARFLRIARGSLAEIGDHLRSALLQKLIDEAEAEAITKLAGRAIGACTRLIQYLDRAERP